MNPGLVFDSPADAHSRFGCRSPSAGPVEALPESPSLGGPDVLCMGGASPGYAGDDAGIVRYRGRRVNEMGMQPRGVFRPFGDEYQRLAETAEAVA